MDETMNVRCENCNGSIEIPMADRDPTIAAQVPGPLAGEYICTHCGSVIQVLRTVDGGFYLLLLSIGPETGND